MKNLTLLSLICFLTLSFCANAYDLNDKSLNDFKIKDKALGFFENKGQISDQHGAPRPDVLYMFDQKGFKCQLKRNGFSYEKYKTEIKYAKTSMHAYEGLPDFARNAPEVNFHSHRIDVRLIGANNYPEISAEGKSSDFENYYASVVPEGATYVKHYQEITYKNIYNNIDFVFYLNENGSVKYDIVVHPGGNVEDIQIEYSGAEDIYINEERSLVIKTAQGNIIETRPFAYITASGSNPSGEKAPIDAEFILNGSTVEFEIPPYNSNKTLTIDPEIIWASYYGDDSYDAILAVERDKSNNVVVAGKTASRNNIATSGTYQTTYGGGSFDAFVAKFDRTGSRLWGTYCGGDSADVAYGIAADRVWYDIIIMGSTKSRHGLASDDVYQEEYGGGYSDAFLAKFDQNGQRYWCTYYGGRDASQLIGGDYLYGGTMDKYGDVYVTGATTSRDTIASKHAHQDELGGDFDGFLAKFNSDGYKEWGTYYGGDGFDGSYGIAFDTIGYVTIGGYTASDNGEHIIATEDAFKTSRSGNSDAFVARFNLRGTRQWGTYFGGSQQEVVNCIGADKDKNVIIAGNTQSASGIASSGAHQTSHQGGRDGFVAKFSEDGDRLWSTYYGGDMLDDVTGIDCDTEGNICFAGYTSSETNIASPGSFQDSFVGDTIWEYDDNEGEWFIAAIHYDGFLAFLNPSGERVWGSYFAAPSTDQIRCLSFDNNDNILIGGDTESDDSLATDGAFKTTYSGEIDAFVAKIGSFLRITNVSAPICVGNDIAIEYETATEFNAGNVFTAQLSNSSGDFSSPVNIGSRSATDDGEIIASIPADTPPATGYRVRVVGSNPSKISPDNGMDLTVNPLPEPTVSGNNPACSRTSVTYTTEDDANLQILWSVEGGEIQGDSTNSSVSVVWEDIDEGTIKVVQRNTETGCLDSLVEEIDVNISPNPIINGETEVVSYTQELYSTPSNSKHEYLWTVEGGEIEGDSTNNAALVNWGGIGAGKIKLKVTHEETGCWDTLSVQIAINATPIDINGEKTVCAESLEEYYVSSEENKDYLWETEGGEIQGEDSDTLISVLWGDAGNGLIRLIRTNTETDEIDTTFSNITILELPEVGLFGSNEICEGDNDVYRAENTEGVESKWTVYNGEIIGDDDADSIIVAWNEIPSGEDSAFVIGGVTLEQTSLETGCSNSKTKSVNISAKPSANVLGDFSVCENEIEIYEAEEYEEGFINEWHIEGGVIIGSSEESNLQVEWGQPGEGSLKLIQTSITNCVDSMSYDITINANPPKPNISQAGKTLVSSSEEGNQWYSGGEKIEGATDKVYSPDSSGYYAVRVIDSNGCVSPMSDPYYFDINRVIDFEKSKNMLALYPNPTEGLLNIEFRKKINYPVTIEIKNLLGITLKTITTNESLSVDIGEFSSGTYIINVKIRGDVYGYKLIKL